MTERRRAGTSFESWIDRQIREATERGEFDNLAGAGKPIPGADRPDDELWWVKDYIRREGLPAEAMLPTPLRLRKEIERVPETVAKLRDERAVRDVVAELNRRIAAWLLAPDGPQVPVRLVNADDTVRRWRADREAARPRPAAPAAADPPRPARHRWWRRRGRGPA